MDQRLQQALLDASLNQPREIPKDFLLGAATAAFQIEGAAFDDGKLASIWDTFSRVPGAVAGGDNGDVACDHYNRYKNDVALMKQMGLDSYRFSVSWARVCPDGHTLNPAGLDFYERLVDELLESGISPWLTLYHWDLPQAVQDNGGWPHRDTANLFADYSMKVYDRLGDRVKVWTTLNEPWCSSFLSYTAGEHAPGHQSLVEGMRSSHHLLLGHGMVIDRLRNANPELNLGITLNMTYAQPLNPESVADQNAARLIDGQINRWFLDPLFRGSYPADILEEFDKISPASVEMFRNAIQPGDMEIISTPFDSFGVNYYQPDHVVGSREIPQEIQERLGVTKFQDPPVSAPATARETASAIPATEGVFTPDSLLPRTGQKWEIDPLMLKLLLLELDEKYTRDAGVSIYVTENGAAFDDTLTLTDKGFEVHDPDRTAFLLLHLGATLDAVEAGANVKGFFYWSFLDNFEWTWGYDKRFGIVYVNYETQERTVKDSGKAYAQVIHDRRINVANDAGTLVRRGTLLEGRNLPLENRN